MDHRGIRVVLVLAVVFVLPGCIVIQQAPPAPEVPRKERVQEPVRKPDREPETLEPAGGDRRKKFSPSALGFRLILPAILDGRTRAKDGGRGGGLTFDELDLEMGPGIEVTGSDIDPHGEPMSGRLYYFSFEGENILTTAESYGGAVYPAGTLLKSRLDWAGVEFRTPAEPDRPYVEGDLEVDLTVGAWWLGMEVGEDSIDSMAIVGGPSARFVSRPDPRLEIGAEASALVGIGLPFPGYAGSTKLEAWAGLTLQGNLKVIIGYTHRTSVTKTVNLDSNEATGSIDRDRVVFTVGGPFFAIDLVF